MLFLTHFMVRTYWMPNIKQMTAESSRIEDQLQACLPSSPAHQVLSGFESE